MEKTTYKALRNLVGATRDKVLPTARVLRDSGTPVIARAEVTDGSLTVYENGFYAYSTSSGTTVYAVDRCAEYAYEGGGVLPEEVFDDVGWAVRLMLAGEDRLEHNNNAREQGNHFSYSADTTERGDLRDPHDFVADIENRDLVERMVACLTEKQQRTVRMYFGEGMRQEDMAVHLGTSRQAVTKLIDSAKKKIRIFADFFAE